MNKMNEILNDIERLRDKMIKVTLEKGFTNHESVKISQELDKLINYYQKAQLTHAKRSSTGKNIIRN